MRKIRVSSVLAPSFRDELEHIVFFNPGQELVKVPLLESIHRYGVPSIVEEHDCLRFRVASFGILQTFYAIDDTETPARLAGVAMFTRHKRNSILIVHLAAHEHYAAKGKWARASVVGHLVAAIRAACLRTRGVHSLCIPYPHEVRLDLRTRPPRPVEVAHQAGGADGLAKHRNS